MPKIPPLMPHAPTATTTLGSGGGGRGVRRPPLRTRRHTALATILRCLDHRSAGGRGAGAALRPPGSGGYHLRARRHSRVGGNPEVVPPGVKIVMMRFPGSCEEISWQAGY